MCVTGQNHKKFTKTPLLGVQGHLRSSMLINLKSPPPVLVMICRMSVPICNCFHTRRDNGDKIMSFQSGTPFDALVGGEPPHPRVRNFVTNNWSP